MSLGIKGVIKEKFVCKYSCGICVMVDKENNNRINALRTNYGIFLVN